MAKKILLIRTHKDLNAGGAVPPLGLLYLASSIFRKFNGQYDVKILNTGLNGVSLDGELARFQPDILGISAMTCESDLMGQAASGAKRLSKKCVVVAGGPHASLAKESLLEDANIDFAVIGEGEETLPELLNALENKADLSGVPGIAYRKEGRPALNPAREPIRDLQAVNIIPRAWGLIDIKAYSGYANWNGVCRNKYYAAVLTSRGCPFKCFFCRSRDTFGSGFRGRRPEDVVDELDFLNKKLGVREIHIFDDVFNYDRQRAMDICRLIIDRKLKIDIAFPNGLRADLMTPDMVDMFKAAGVYKINYGIESASVALQKTLGKGLDIGRVKETIDRTVKAGIITAGYFIFGFPGESRDDIRETIDFAVRSPLDNAYFFKFTDFSTFNKPAVTGQRDLSDLHFHSQEGNGAGIPAAELNGFILTAQRRFYCGFKRLWRAFLRTPRKAAFFGSLLSVFSLIISSYLVSKLSADKETGVRP